MLPNITLLFEYFSISLYISLKLILIIIPDTNNKIMLINVFDKNLYKKMYAMSAPNTSEKPLINVYLNSYNM